MSCASTHTDRDLAASPTGVHADVAAGLWAVLSAQVHELAGANGLACECEQDIGEGVPGPAAALVADIAVIVQEMMLNVARHADVHEVQVRVRASHSDLTVLLKDEGRGAPPSAFERTNLGGVALMRERARRLGGWLHISSQPGQGTQLILSLPYDRLRATPHLFHGAPA